MSVKIVEGETYRSAKGEKIGPVEHWAGITDRVRVRSRIDSRYWFMDGTGGGYAAGDNLVAVWTEGPVRTVIRREVVSGEYGHILVDGMENGGCLIKLGFKTTGNVFPMVRSLFSANELRSAAMVFSQIAEAMDDGESK